MSAVCSKCGLSSPAVGFYSSKKTRMCKACVRASSRDYVSRNREICLNRSKTYAKLHPEKIREISHRAYLRRASRKRLEIRVRYRGIFCGPKFVLRSEEKFAGPPEPSSVEIFKRDGFCLLLLVYAKLLSVKAKRREFERVRDRLKGKGHRRKGKVDFLFGRQKGKCAVCRECLTSFDVDHIIPRSAGGGNEVTNLQLLCKPCNNAKSAKHPVDFMQERGYLL